MMKEVNFSTWTYPTGWPTSQRPRTTFSYCVTAKSHIIRMGAHEQHAMSSLLTHVPLLS